MHKQSINEQRHELYPHRTDPFFGSTLFNDTPTFRAIPPEYLRKMLDAQSEQSFLTDAKYNFPIFLGCWDGVICSPPEGGHENCYSVLKQNGALLRMFYSCDYSDLSDLIDDMRDFGGQILVGSQVEKLIAAAPTSSIYYNPFVGFDNPDKKNAPQEWLVKDTFPMRSLNAIVGISDSFKSFLAIHLACCIATGTEYFGKKVQQGPVLYFAPEGGEGVPKRRAAWQIENSWSNCYIPFYIRSKSFSFSSEDDLQFLRNTLSVSSEFAPKAVFFDTLGQSLGSHDENSAKDMNKVARYLNDLKSEFNCSFFWVDHAGYEAKRSRGSSAKFGALDTEFFVSRTGDELKVQNTKMKDADKCSTLYLQSEQLHGSLILKQIEQPQTHTETLLKIIKEETDRSLKSIRKKFYDVCKAETPQSKQKALKRALDTLLKAEKILQQQTPDGAKLILTTESGHAHPPL